MSSLAKERIRRFSQSSKTHPSTLTWEIFGGLQDAAAYGYDPEGNISWIQDWSSKESRTFGYDALDRLTSASATGGSAPYSQTFSYNPIGNMMTKNSTTFTPDSVHKHAVLSMSSGESYAYDANGNQTCRVEAGVSWKQEYDVENRLTAVKKMSGDCAGTALETTTFAYDGDGNLVKKVNPNGSRTLYIGNVYEVDKNASGGVTGTRNYYPAAGAMRINSTLYFLRADHLGSATAVTDSSGNVTGRQLYYPFGQTRLVTGAMYTDRLFTGQREMPGLGIYHYNARFYSPVNNHFLSADTIVPGDANPQSLNRFSYVLNNPLRYSDPSGHMIIGDDYPGCGICTPLPPSDSGNSNEGNGDGENGNNGNDFCDPILGCENPDAGIFCDQTSCWYDVSTDISGTYQDPAVYLSLAAGGWASGLVSDVGWLGLYNCLRISSCARLIASTTGITVYRVWGGNPNEPGVNYSSPYGSSWTPIPPNIAERLFGTTFRNVAGLPDINNMGRFLSTGTINDVSVVSEIQSATTISPNSGGLLEYIIFNAENVINLTRIQGINPPF